MKSKLKKNPHLVRKNSVQEKQYWTTVQNTQFNDSDTTGNNIADGLEGSDYVRDPNGNSQQLNNENNSDFKKSFKLRFAEKIKDHWFDIFVSIITIILIPTLVWICKSIIRQEIDIATANVEISYLEKSIDLINDSNEDIYRIKADVEYLKTELQSNLKVDMKEINTQIQSINNQINRMIREDSSYKF